MSETPVNERIPAHCGTVRHTTQGPAKPRTPVRIRTPPLDEISYNVGGFIIGVVEMRSIYRSHLPQLSEFQLDRLQSPVLRFESGRRLEQSLPIWRPASSLLKK